jgi:hypothetical protein
MYYDPGHRTIKMSDCEDFIARMTEQKYSENYTQSCYISIDPEYPEALPDPHPSASMIIISRNVLLGFSIAFGIIMAIVIIAMIINGVRYWYLKKLEQKETNIHELCLRSASRPCTDASIAFDAAIKEAQTQELENISGFDIRETIKRNVTREVSLQIERVMNILLADYNICEATRETQIDVA